MTRGPRRDRLPVSDRAAILGTLGVRGDPGGERRAARGLPSFVFDLPEEARGLGSHGSLMRRVRGQVRRSRAPRVTVGRQYTDAWHTCAAWKSAALFDRAIHLLDVADQPVASPLGEADAIGLLAAAEEDHLGGVGLTAGGHAPGAGGPAPVEPIR